LKLALLFYKKYGFGDDVLSDKQRIRAGKQPPDIYPNKKTRQAIYSGERTKLKRLPIFLINIKGQFFC
jgi:hypothetical protein